MTDDINAPTVERLRGLPPAMRDKIKTAWPKDIPPRPPWSVEHSIRINRGIDRVVGWDADADQAIVGAVRARVQAMVAQLGLDEPDQIRALVGYTFGSYAEMGDFDVSQLESLLATMRRVNMGLLILCLADDGETWVVRAPDGHNRAITDLSAVPLHEGAAIITTVTADGEILHRRYIGKDATAPVWRMVKKYPGQIGQDTTGDTK